MFCRRDIEREEETKASLGSELVRVRGAGDLAPTPDPDPTTMAGLRRITARVGDQNNKEYSENIEIS